MLASRFKSSYGLNLWMRAAVMRAAANGILKPGPDFFRAFVGHVPDATLRALEARILRAGALDLDDSPLDAAELQTLSGDLARISALDALLANGAQPVPLRGRLGFVSTAVTGATAGNGTPKRISSLAFDGLNHEPTACLALLVVTQELLEIGLGGAAILEAEIAKACAAAVDSVFIAALVSGTPSSAASTGNFAADLHAALAGMPDNSAAWYYAIVAPCTCRQLATVDDGDGQLLYPDVDPAMGGSVGSIRVVPCSALASADSNGPNAVIVDSSQVAIGSTPMAVTLARQASVDLQDVPTNNSATPTPTNLVSLWATNSVGFRAERSVTAALVRENAAHVVTDCAYESEAA